MNDCAICREETSTEAWVCLGRCGHWFHSLCLAQWLSYRLTCPLCRDQVEHLQQAYARQGLVLFAMAFGNCLDRLYDLPTSELSFTHHVHLANLLFCICTAYLTLPNTDTYLLRPTMDSCWKCWDCWKAYFFS